MHTFLFYHFRMRRLQTKKHGNTTLRMFFILGITWTFDIIAFAIQPYETRLVGIEIVLIFFLIVNASHGILFFCIVYFTSQNIRRTRIWWGTKNNNFRKTVSNITYRCSTKSTTSTIIEGVDPLSKNVSIKTRLNMENRQQETAL